MSFRPKVRLTKCPFDEMSVRRNVRRRNVRRRNVLDEMSVDEMSVDEVSAIRKTNNTK